MECPLLYVLLEFLLLLQGLVLTSAQSSTYVLGCPPDSVPNNGWCYYFAVDSNITWYQAQKECARRGGKRLRIETADEMAFVTSMIQKNFRTEGVWTGLNDWNVDQSAGTGSWLWDTEEYPNMKILKWNKEPDNSDNEDCCAVNIQGKFSDERCGRRMGFICELNNAAGFDCPVEWSKVQTTCYYFSQPADAAHIVTWQEAQTICSSWKPIPGHPNAVAHLVTLDTAQDSEVVKQELVELSSTTMQWWTGLNDIQKEGTFQWKNGDTYNSAYISWVTEPDNVGNKEECGLFLMDGTFSDRNCNELHGYACRKDQDVETNLSNMGCDTWIRGGKKCYALFDGPKQTWQQAKQTCIQARGQLLKIETLDQESFINMLLREIDTDSYWTGLNDIGHDMTFKWADNTYSNPYLLNWNKAPDNWGGLGGEDCAIILRNGFWQDVNCQANWVGYICETTLSVGTCRNGWISRPGTKSCYYFSDGTAKLTWIEAQGQCTSYSQNGVTYLFVMTDQQERTWMKKHLASMPDSTPFQYWTGMNDIAVEGRWMYDLPQPTAANMKLVDWNHEPNNWRGDEQCVIIFNGGRLNDAMCSLKRGFICERSVSTFTGSAFALKTATSEASPVKPVVTYLFVTIHIILHTVMT